MLYLIQRAFHKAHSVPDGVGWTPPRREWFTRCCRCGRFRVVGQFVEQHGAQLSDGWWYECLMCALHQSKQLYQRNRRPESTAHREVDLP